MLKPVKYIKYTQKELQSYCNDPSACIKCVTDQITIGIQPSGLACFREAVTEAVVHEKVGLYDAKLTGIVLDVRNIKVLGNEFAIHNDSSILHINLRADLYVFEPRLDAVVKGIIKHIAPGHISVTIHKVFNVAVRLSGPKRDLAINNEVNIKITKFELNYQIPYIEAVLESPRRIIVFEDSDKNGLAQDSGISTEGSSKDVGKVKKRARSISSSESDSSSDAAETRAISLMDSKTVIKQEPRSTDSSSSESNTDEPPSNRRIPKDSEDHKKTIVTMKKENHSSDSSSDESVKKPRSTPSSSDESVKKHRSYDSNNEDMRSNTAHGKTTPEPNIFPESEYSDSSITPYQKPRTKVTTPPPQLTIKTEEFKQNSPEKSPTKRRRLQSPVPPAVRPTSPPPRENSPSPVPPASPTPSFASKRKRRSSVAPKIYEIISKHIRIKTEANVPLPTPPPSPVKAKKATSIPAPPKVKTKKTPKPTGPPKLPIKTEVGPTPPERSSSPVRPVSPTPSFASKRKRRSSVAPKIDELISKQLFIKTEGPLSMSTPLNALETSKSRKKHTSTTKVTKKKVKIEPGTSVDLLPSLIQSKLPNTEKMTKRRESSKRKYTDVDSLVYNKVLVEKAAKPAAKKLPEKIKKQKNAKKDVESLMLKVLANKICEAVSLSPVQSPSINDSTMIPNASQFGSPALSSTRNESRPAKKFKSKKAELLNKMLSKR